MGYEAGVQKGGAMRMRVGVGSTSLAPKLFHDIKYFIGFK